MTVGENIRRIRKERDAISKRRLQNMGQEDKYYIKNHHPAIVSEDIFDKAGVILQKEEKKKPLIMARILNVENLLSAMVCKEEMDLEFVLYDPVIRENNRLFMLKGNKNIL